MSFRVKKIAIVLLMTSLIGLSYEVVSDGEFVPQVFAGAAVNQDVEPLRCIGFSPYVHGYDPDSGPHPTRRLIRKLLNKIVQQTSFRCIMTYGMLNGLDYTFAAAQTRGLKVIAIIWLGPDVSVNDQSIEGGIQAAKTYPETIIRLSCGSEVRTRHGNALDSIITDCIARLRAAGVSQPITTIDTWWEVCNRSWPCQESALFASVDWIGANVFPWWENKFSGFFPCTTAAEAADFHIARLQDVMAIYPNKQVTLTEFGWPAGPQGYSETNRFTGQTCGVASSANQSLVIRNTIANLDAYGWSGVVFEAFREDWKVNEGVVGPFWGICTGTPPYRCEALY